MPQSRNGEANDGTLAREAEPVRRWLLGYFRRRIDEESEVEDLVQDVFTRIVSRDSIEPVEHLGGYILKTARSVLADRARWRWSHRTQAHVAFDPERHGDEDMDAERILTGREELQAATAALLSLPERTRTVFILRRLEGYKHREIANRLGISVSAVEKHVVRAVRHLSLEMERRS